jgi:hypothetical protein
MKLLLFLTLIAALAVLPFVAIKRPWALRLWRRVKMVIAAYILVLVALAVYRLIVNFDAFYG